MDKDYFRIDKSLFEIIAGLADEADGESNFGFLLDDLIIQHNEDFSLKILGINLIPN